MSIRAALAALAVSAIAAAVDGPAPRELRWRSPVELESRALDGGRPWNLYFPSGDIPVGIRARPDGSLCALYAFREQDAGDAMHSVLYLRWSPDGGKTWKPRKLAGNLFDANRRILMEPPEIPAALETAGEELWIAMAAQEEDGAALRVLRADASGVQEVAHWDWDALCAGGMPGAAPARVGLSAAGDRRSVWTLVRIGSEESEEPERVAVLRLESADRGKTWGKPETLLAPRAAAEVPPGSIHLRYAPDGSAELSYFDAKREACVLLNRPAAGGALQRRETDLYPDYFERLFTVHALRPVAWRGGERWAIHAARPDLLKESIDLVRGLDGRESPRTAALPSSPVWLREGASDGSEGILCFQQGDYRPDSARGMAPRRMEAGKSRLLRLTADSTREEPWTRGIRAQTGFPAACLDAGGTVHALVQAEWEGRRTLLYRRGDPATADDDRQRRDLEASVRQTVRDLGSRDDAVRDAARSALVRLYPGCMELLPALYPEDPFTASQVRKFVEPLLPAWMERPWPNPKQ